jgi:hypothetical protein
MGQVGGNRVAAADPASVPATPADEGFTWPGIVHIWTIWPTALLIPGPDRKPCRPWGRRLLPVAVQHGQVGCSRVAT